MELFLVSRVNIKMILVILMHINYVRGSDHFYENRGHMVHPKAGAYTRGGRGAFSETAQRDRERDRAGIFES